MAIGYKDSKGNEIIEEDMPAHLEITPKGNYLVYLWVGEQTTLHTMRKDRKAAYDLDNYIREHVKLNKV